ncbi:MAG: YciN family protein [Aeromonadaceae bacterium]|mgnify:FL=1|nr:YciN family protein [Aeromonadaceae bacterium]MBP9568687.1 YciN family protein [Aeromonadaceae bacterium]
MADRQPIQHQDLLTMANQMIRDHEDFIQGMQADQVEQKGGILVFKGEFFLDEQGLPTPKTMAVFNMFKYLAQTLSGQYQLVD